NLKAINDDIDRQREEFMRRVRTIKSDIKRIDDKKNPDQQDKQRRKELMAEKSYIYKDIGKLEEQRRKRISEEVGKGPAVWIGPALERSVVDPVHSFIARFNIANRNEFNFDGSKVPGGVGIMEVYFRDEHGNKICKVSFGDSNGSRETKNSASFVIDDERHSMIWEPSGWNDFHGVVEVVRDTAMWFVKVASTTADGREYKIREIGPIYAEPGGVGENDVKTVQIAIRKYIGSQRIYARFQEMKFWDFIGTYEYPDFRPVHRFDAGDEILINMKNDRVEVNGEKRTDLVLASSEFFKLVKGENTIKLSDNLI